MICHFAGRFDGLLPGRANFNPPAHARLVPLGKAKYTAYSSWDTELGHRVAKLSLHRYMV